MIFKDELNKIPAFSLFVFDLGRSLVVACSVTQGFWLIHGSYFYINEIYFPADHCRFQKCCKSERMSIAAARSIGPRSTGAGEAAAVGGEELQFLPGSLLQEACSLHSAEDGHPRRRLLRFLLCSYRSLHSSEG